MSPAWLDSRHNTRSAGLIILGLRGPQHELGHSKDAMQIELTEDQALVLLEFFARFQETNRLSLRSNAEFIALSAIAGQLERTLVEPFQANYAALLGAATARVQEGYEGVAPGVEVKRRGRWARQS